MALLRRMLRSATHDDLQNVMQQTARFIDGLRKAGLYLDPELLVNESAQYLATVPGSGSTDWTDPPGEIDPSEASDNELPNGYDGEVKGEGLATPSDLNSGYEAPLEGDSDVDGTEPAETLQSDGTG